MLFSIIIVLFANYYLIITIIFLHTNYITYYGFVCSQHMTKHFAYYYQFLIMVDLSLQLKASVEMEDYVYHKNIYALTYIKASYFKEFKFSFLHKN